MLNLTYVGQLHLKSSCSVCTMEAPLNKNGQQYKVESLALDSRLQHNLVEFQIQLP